MAARKQLRLTVRSYGLYEAWTSGQKHLPILQQFTNLIPATIGIEFGMIVNIQHGRGHKLDWKMEHPPFVNQQTGRVEPAFHGQEHIPNNNYDFFLGDTVWQPWQDKCGPWTLTISHRKQQLAQHSFLLVDPSTIDG